MTRNDKVPKARRDMETDRRLWRRSRLIDAPEDEAGRLLDLAAFADGLLDDDEHARIAALLAADPDAAADVETARTSVRCDQTSAELERVIARACAIVPDTAPPRGQVVSFVPNRRPSFVPYFAQWGSIAAAILVAGWLGFSMGSDTSLALTSSGQSSDAVFPELFDQASGFLRDLGEGLRT
jgi:anti-sigma factor RsiW